MNTGFMDVWLVLISGGVGRAVAAAAAAAAAVVASKISRRKFCGSPPLKPSLQAICSDSDDWWLTLQLDNGSGLSARSAQRETTANHRVENIIRLISI